MKNNNKNPHKKVETNFLVKIGRLLLIVVFAYVVYDVGKGTYSGHLLKENGICTKAVVYKREKGNRGKGDVITKYKFVWNDITYQGISYYDSKTEGKTWFNDKYVIGDTIIVVFLESNPNINKSNTSIGKDCDCGE